MIFFYVFSIIILYYLHYNTNIYTWFNHNRKVLSGDHDTAMRLSMLQCFLLICSYFYLSAFEHEALETIFNILVTYGKFVWSFEGALKANFLGRCLLELIKLSTYNFSLLLAHLWSDCTRSCHCPQLDMHTQTVSWQYHHERS